MSTNEINTEVLEVNNRKKFSDFEIPDFLVSSLESGGIVHPSPVQEKSLEFSLAGRDILASAQTGTGKTIAFLLPIIIRMLENPDSNALILAPTRELAVQVKEAAFKLLPKGSSIKTIALIGGEPITKQFFQLKGFEEGAVRPKKPEAGGRFQRRGGRDNFERPTGGNGVHKNVIFVGTPGRVKDHLDRGNFSLKAAHFLVLDETDRMLDLGFKDTLEEIFAFLPSERQTMMFSATMPSKIVSMSKDYLKNPIRVDIEKKAENAPKIKQEVVKYSYSQKFKILAKLLKENLKSAGENQKQETAIIFVKTKMGSEELSAKLESEDFAVRAIHGDLKQKDRDFVIRAFKEGKISIMVATDVAARGLHVPHIKYVINYDLPQCKEDYIHRIGRTGRAGEEGNAISFVNEDDRREMSVAVSYMKTNDSLDDEDADVKSFRSDYAGKKKRFGGGFSGGSGGGFRGGSSGGGGFGGGERRGGSSGGFGGGERRGGSSGGFGGGERREYGSNDRFGEKSGHSERKDFGGRGDRPDRGSFDKRSGDRRGGSSGGFGGNKRDNYDN